MSSNQRWVLGLTAVASLMVVLDALVVSNALSTMRVEIFTRRLRSWTHNRCPPERSTHAPERHGVDPAHITQEEPDD
jgi:hypothetical protein